MSRRWPSRRVAIVAVLTLAVLGLVTSGAASGAGNGLGPGAYAVTNLVSDGNVPALHTDPNLVNAWGLTANSASPWWVANNGTGTSTLYNGQGIAQPAPPAGPLVVSVDDSPTGAVANTSGDFVVRDGIFSGPAAFLFATESGLILGWNRNVPPPPLSHQTEVGVDTGGSAVFKGLAIGSVGTSNFLYATDFVGGKIDVYDGNFNPVTTMSFVDPKLPAGYGPFGIQNLGGRLFVTYAKQSGGHDEVHGQGLGIVDEFATDGTLIARVATHGQLNAPWGLAMAPSDFGRFSGDLIVGNFGSGRIDAFRPLPNGHFVFVGELRREDKVITIDGLWGLGFGNGAASGPTNTLYFTAGPNDESDGLFGAIAPTQ